MDQAELTSPLPVEGIVFDRSGVKTLSLALLWGIAFVLGACLVSGAVAGRVNQRNKGLLGGGLLMVAAPLMLAREARSWWARRRLIVGQDCIQVIEQRGGEDRVVLQIPYANIAEYKYEMTANRVGIDLRRLDDADTYAPSENFKRNRQTKGRHYCITVGYRAGPRVIASEIEEAYSRWSSLSPTERSRKAEPRP